MTSPMPFLRAGGNFRSTDTGIRGWTRPATRTRGFAPAKLIRFKSGDLAWMHNAAAPRFLAWGHAVIVGSYGIELPEEWQEGLPHSTLSENGEKPRPVEARLELPYPVSANKYWRHVPNKRTGLTMHFLSDEAKAYKEAVGWIAKAAGFKHPTEKLLEIRSITLHPRLYNAEGKRIGAMMDLGNCWKIAEDALQGVVYANDRQIKRFGRIEYGLPTTHGALIVELAEFTIPIELAQLEVAG